MKVESSDVIVAPNGVFQGMQVSMSADDLKKARDGQGQILF
jgi:hypothetical protein